MNWLGSRQRGSAETADPVPVVRTPNPVPAAAGPRRVDPVEGQRRDADGGDGSSVVDGSMWWWLLLVALASAKRQPSHHEEPVIEEVTAKQLERVLSEKDYVAVFWCKYQAFCLLSQCAVCVPMLCIIISSCGTACSDSVSVSVRPQERSSHPKPDDGRQCDSVRLASGCHIPIWRV